VSFFDYKISWGDGTRATVPIAQSTIALYPQLQAECDQQLAIDRRL